MTPHLRRLIGRVHERDAVDAALRAGRTVWLLGASGSGKSRLVTAVADDWSAPPGSAHDMTGTHTDPHSPALVVARLAQHVSWTRAAEWLLAASAAATVPPTPDGEGLLRRAAPEWPRLVAQFDERLARWRIESARDAGGRVAVAGSPSDAQALREALVIVARLPRFTRTRLAVVLDDAAPWWSALRSSMPSAGLPLDIGIGLVVTGDVAPPMPPRPSPDVVWLRADEAIASALVAHLTSTWATQFGELLPDAWERLAHAFLDALDDHPGAILRAADLWTWGVAMGHWPMHPQTAVHTAITAALEFDAAPFTASWQRLPAGQRATLLAVSQGGGRGLLGHAGRHQTRLGTSSIQRALDQLVADGVLRVQRQTGQRASHWSFVNPLFGQWVRRLPRL